MEQYVIIEKLKDLIKQRRVVAALFYTFNFDPKFFENYILTLFLPDVNFSDIEIQNTIFWRKYAAELPPVTVYCDFHAKSTDAPSLGYTVKSIDIKTKNGIKPCFHPKNSFLLLEDMTLLVVTGSNNLSVSGWCMNIEGISIFEMKNGAYFPYRLKHELWDFIYGVSALYKSGFQIAEDKSNKDKTAEDKINEFFRQRKHTGQTDISYYNSISGNVSKLLSDLISKNNNAPFQRIEVISSYFTSNIEFVRESLKYTKEGSINALVPYSASNLAGITKEIYNDFQAEGVVWSRMISRNDDKAFRLNHAKIYRLKGETSMFTIIGSVNYTEAGWHGYKLDGNVESAVVHAEPVDHWKDWLTGYDNPDIQFPVSSSDETADDQRYDVPDLRFIIDWLKKQLIYDNPDRVAFNGIIMLAGKNYELIIGKDISIPLNEDQLSFLSDNSIIKVHEYRTQHEYYFYPLHRNIENKSYSTKLKLNDRELIELWQQVSIKEKDKNEISDLLEKFILSRLDNEGELKDGEIRSKSTLNMIASHVNALIKLDERLFQQVSRVGDYKKTKELLDYYLFTNNLDTLTGYRNLLKEMIQEKAILPAVAWFLLKLLSLNFYDASKVLKAYSSLRSTLDGLKDKIETIQKEIGDEVKILKKSINPGEINEKLYKWITDQIIS